MFLILLFIQQNSSSFREGIHNLNSSSLNTHGLVSVSKRFCKILKVFYISSIAIAIIAIAICHKFNWRSQKAMQKGRGVVVGLLLHVSNNYTNYLTVKILSFSSLVEIQLSSWVLIKVTMHVCAHNEMISVILGNRNALFIS